MVSGTVLIVEDEALIADSIEEKIKSLGFSALDKVQSYDKAIECLKKYRPDVILLDIHLNSSKNGIDLAKTIDKNYNIPYIYLTNDDSEQTAIELSKTNQVACINKDFTLKTLKSNLLIAINQNDTLLYLENGYTYNKAEQIIYYYNKPIKLSKNEKELLSLLIQSKGNFVDSQSILNNVWSIKPPTANSAVRELVRSLRKKLKNLTIKNKSGLGYMLP